MTKHNPITDQLRQQYPDCAAKGCGLAAYGWSRYCVKHREQYYNTRSTREGARILRSRDLKPYREMSAAYYAKHGEHPAMVAAVDWLDGLLVKAAKGGKDALSTQLRRLFVDGANGERMFLRIAAVSGYIHFNARTFPDDACATTNLGHAALSTTRMPRKLLANGKTHPTRFLPTTAFAMGESIREVLGVLLASYWGAIDRSLHALEDARGVVNKCLRDSPL